MTSATSTASDPPDAPGDRPWERADLPAGRREGRGGAGDVRRHRPPLRPGQPGHDVPPGRRLATARRCAALGLAAGLARCSTSPRGTGDLCVDLAAGRLPADRRSTCRSACWPPTAAARPASRPTSSRLPVPDGAVDGVTCGFALRNLVDLGAVLRRAGPGRAPGRPHRPARGGRARPTRCCAAGHGVYFGTGRAPDRRAAVGPGRLPLPAPKSVAYLPPPDELLDAAAPRRVRRRRTARLLSRRHHPARCTATRAMKAVDPAASSGDARPRSRVAARRRLPVRPRRRRPRRPRAWPLRVPRRPTSADAARPRIERRRRGRRCPAAGPWPSARCPFLPGAPAELVVPAVVVGEAADGTALGHARSTAPTADLGTGRPRRRPRGRRLHASRPGFDPGRASRPPSCRGPRRACGPAGSTKVVLAREIVVEADRPLDVHAVLPAAAGLVRLELPASPSTASSAPAPSCSWPATATSCAPTRWPAPRRAPAIPATDARLAAELIASTKDQVEHRVTIEMVHDTLLPWCSYLDWEAEPSIVTVANVQHLGTARRGAAVVAAAVGARAGGRPAADAGARRPPAGRGAGAHRRARGRSTAAATAVRSAGSTPTATAQWAVGIRCAEIDGARGPAVRRRRRGRRLATPTPSWPRPRPSSRPCSRPSCGRDAGAECRPADVVAGMQVEIYSDVVCPWCYIGKRRFEAALWRAFDGRDDVDGRVAAVPARSARPDRRRRPSLDAYARKFGGPEEAMRIIDRRDRRRPPTEGLDFHLDDRPAGQHLRRPPAACGCAERDGRPGRDEGAAAAGLLHRGRRRRPTTTSWLDLAAEVGLDRDRGRLRSSPPTTASPRCASRAASRPRAGRHRRADVRVRGPLGRARRPGRRHDAAGAGRSDAWRGAAERRRRLHRRRRERLRREALQVAAQSAAAPRR